MVNVVYFATSLICFILLQFVNCQNYVGDICTLQSTGGQGQCQLLEKCQAAIQALQTGVFPQTCGFDGPQPIVCCAGGGPITRPPPTVATTRSTTTVRTIPTTRSTTRATTARPVNLKVGDRSRQKCKEYSKYIVEEGAVFVSGAGPISSEECAIAAVVNVVGGEITRPKEFPHMALIGFDDGSGRKLWQCGGSLVSERFVLTAGHCLYDKQYGDALYIIVGDLLPLDNNSNAQIQEFNIAKRYMNPNYIPPAHYNDIALLKTDQQVKIDSHVLPACLPQSSVFLEGIYTAAKCEPINPAAGRSKRLSKANVVLIPHKQCNDSYKHNLSRKLRYGVIDSMQICAASTRTDTDTCQGDSGGPLQVANCCDKYCTYTVVGVTSFGKVCGVANIPGVYTRVSYYIAWIEHIVWP